MSSHSDNESWIIEVGDAVIQKKAREGPSSLSSLERLIYCLWVADYGMRNAGDLETAQDVYADFQAEGRRIAQELGLAATHEAFALRTADLEEEYFERFEEVCNELRGLSNHPNDHS